MFDLDDYILGAAVLETVWVNSDIQVLEMAQLQRLEPFGKYLVF